MESQEYREVYDALTNLGTADLEMPTTVVEALDYVANYCGDMSFGREVTLYPAVDEFRDLMKEVAKTLQKRGYIVGKREGDAFKEETWEVALAPNSN